jgi:hypothetical protein
MAPFRPTLPLGFVRVNSPESKIEFHRARFFPLVAISTCQVVRLCSKQFWRCTGVWSGQRRTAAPKDYE